MCRRLRSIEYGFSAVAETGSLDAAMARAAATPGLLRKRDADRVRRWFATWVTRGWFRAA